MPGEAGGLPSIQDHPELHSQESLSVIWNIDYISNYLGFQHRMELLVSQVVYVQTVTPTVPFAGHTAKLSAGRGRCHHGET